jgi:predicted molibdopterin-dependent oxidoreductase YjgC
MVRRDFYLMEKRGSEIGLLNSILKDKILEGEAYNEFMKDKNIDYFKDCSHMLCVVKNSNERYGGEIKLFLVKNTDIIDNNFSYNQVINALKGCEVRFPEIKGNLVRGGRHDKTEYTIIDFYVVPAENQ